MNLNDLPSRYERECLFIDGDAANVNHPPHYTSHPSGIEVIEITRLLPADLANAVKYVCRFTGKGRPLQDLQKAAWYLRDFCDRLGQDPGSYYTPMRGLLTSKMARYIAKETNTAVQEILTLILEAMTLDGMEAAEGTERVDFIARALARVIELGEPFAATAHAELLR